MKKNKALFIIVMLLALSVGLLGSSWLIRSYGLKEGADGEGNHDFKITASFWPVYISAINLTEGARNVTVTDIAPASAGCLHDYQLTPGNMKTLKNSDVFYVNGGGIESFLKDKGVRMAETVDLSADIKKSEMIRDENETNGHFWMSVRLYRKSLLTMKNDLVKRNPVNKDIYEKNYRTYDRKLEELSQEEESLAKESGIEAVTFHEAFGYLTRDLGIENVYTLDLDEERQVSAGEVRDVLRELKTMKKPLIFAERTYGSAFGRRMEKEAGASVIYLDPLTGIGHESDPDDPDGYIDGMRKNIKMIKESLIGG